MNSWDSQLRCALALLLIFPKVGRPFFVKAKPFSKWPFACIPFTYKDDACEGQLSEGLAFKKKGGPL